MRLRLEASRDYASFEQKLYNGHFQFALPNPYQALGSTQHGYRIFGKVGNDQEFRGIILVRKGSSIKTIADLQGKTISYPASTAVAATLLPQWFLHMNGLDPLKDVRTRYVGSQESSIMNVYLGQTDAAATWPPPWQQFSLENPAKAAELDVKWQTPPLINNGLVVRNDVPADIVRQVSDLLFNLQTTPEGKAILAAMGVSDLESADIHTYDPARIFIARFEHDIRPVEAKP